MHLFHHSTGWFWTYLCDGTLVMCVVLIYIFAVVAQPSGSEVDRLALLDLKNQVTQDPNNIMMAWNASIHHCNWPGVICSPTNERRVVTLDLRSQQLTGGIPPSIGNLTFLTGINLRNNSFRGEIPQETGRLLRLQHLNLTSNFFTGYIPTNLTNCRELEVLALELNELIGQIPNQLSSLSNLSYLGLGGNNLTGNIPPWVGNLTFLAAISLALNNLQGSIPPELGRLRSIRIIQFYGNSLSGTIPESIFNISSLTFISVTQNQLYGRLPTDVGFTLPNLETFAGGVNNFTGPIPTTLSNASRLSLIDFAENGLTGTVPTVLGNLPSLYRINFDQNRLGYSGTGDLSFIDSLTNCTNLEVLGLSENLFGGELPNSIANLSGKLDILTLGSNVLDGSIPRGIGNLVNLRLLGLEGNGFSGSIPDTIGNLVNLQGLYLNYNQFLGPIPSALGNLTSLTRLFAEGNRLEGNIPTELGKCQNLQVINLTSNNLVGPIPKEIMGISSLSISLSLAKNSLTGSLPAEVGKLMNLKELDVSDNNLFGEIPSTIGSCISLEVLDMSNNSLQGELPASLKALRGLEEVDFSHNNLSGEIPKFFGEFSSLRKLDLSFNDFEGQVSTEGIFANASIVTLSGNDKLCGGVFNLNLPACSIAKNHPSRRNQIVVKIVIPVTAATILSIAVLCSFTAYYLSKKSRKKPLASSSFIEWTQLGASYQDIMRATKGLSEENLIGSGSFGSVYKADLKDDGTYVAVKVLNLHQRGAIKSFMDECRALQSIRHRNLLRIVTACSSTDDQGNEFKCLVFEYMCNGNLDQWLHPRDDEHYRNKRLSIFERLNIAIDVACALDYLHNYCQTPIVHCDLKPSNILLDEDLTAHVGDFGLATFLLRESHYRTMSTELKGSIGYIPPEYGSGSHVSPLGDIYSYGILVLELFTGKRPTDEIFKEGLDIHRYTAMSLPFHVMEIIDPIMISEEDKEEIDQMDGKRVKEKAINSGYLQQQSAGIRMEECLVAIMRIGLSCSSNLPSGRMPISIVVNRMLAVRDSFFRFDKRTPRMNNGENLAMC